MYGYTMTPDMLERQKQTDAEEKACAVLAARKAFERGFTYSCGYKMTLEDWIPLLDKYRREHSMSSLFSFGRRCLDIYELNFLAALARMVPFDPEKPWNYPDEIA